MMAAGATEEPSGAEPSTSKPAGPAEQPARMTEIKVYKKSTPNGKLSLYLNNREFALKTGKTTIVDGLAVINPSQVKDRLVYAQVHLNFRYGREDEEVMGLTFSTEAVLSSEVIYPPEHATTKVQCARLALTTFQEVLMKKIGEEAIPFFFEISDLSPPSVHLNPAKQYEGAPIGISYDVRIFMASPNERPQRKHTVRMSIRLYRECPRATLPKDPPSVYGEKTFMLCDGKVTLTASLDKSVYHHGEKIFVKMKVCNLTNRTIKRIHAHAVQFTDVTMFSTGKFRNIVADLDLRDGVPIPAGETLSSGFHLLPAVGAAKRWIAVQDVTHENLRNVLVSSIMKTDKEEANVFSIFVSYYVKIKCVVSGIPVVGKFSVKLPFVLIQPNHISDPTDAPSPTAELRSRIRALTAKDAIIGSPSGRRGAGNSLRQGRTAKPDGAEVVAADAGGTQQQQENVNRIPESGHDSMGNDGDKNNDSAEQQHGGSDGNQESRKDLGNASGDQNHFTTALQIHDAPRDAVVSGQMTNEAEIAHSSASDLACKDVLVKGRREKLGENGVESETCSSEGAPDSQQEGSGEIRKAPCK